MYFKGIINVSLDIRKVIYLFYNLKEPAIQGKGNDSIILSFIREKFTATFS